MQVCGSDALAAKLVDRHSVVTDYICFIFHI